MIFFIAEFQRKVLLLLFEIRDLIKSKPTDPDEEVLLIQQCQSMEELEALEKTLRDISVRKNVVRCCITRTKDVPVIRFNPV